MTEPLLTAEEMELAAGKQTAWPTFENQGKALCHAQLVKVVKWLEEPCKDHYNGGVSFYVTPRHKCAECMESLKELVKP